MVLTAAIPLVPTCFAFLFTFETTSMFSTYFVPYRATTAAPPRLSAATSGFKSHSTHWLPWPTIRAHYPVACLPFVQVPDRTVHTYRFHCLCGLVRFHLNVKYTVPPTEHPGGPPAAYPAAASHPVQYNRLIYDFLLQNTPLLNTTYFFLEHPT